MPDHRFLSWGLGIQSTTLLAMAALGEFEKLDAVITSDTMDERHGSYVHAKWYKQWAEEHGLRVEITSAGNIRELGATPHVHIPFWTSSGGPLQRQCTNHFKIIPTKRRARRVAGYDETKPPHPRPGSFELWLGISWDEWERMSTSETKFMVNRYPLIERRMTRDDCIAWLESRGLPVPGKSACIVCPYRSASEWLEMKLYSPDEFASAVEFDEKNRRNPLASDGSTASELFIWREAVPLKDADLEAAAKRERTSKQIPLMVCTGNHCWT